MNENKVLSKAKFNIITTSWSKVISLMRFYRQPDLRYYHPNPIGLGTTLQ